VQSFFAFEFLSPRSLEDPITRLIFGSSADFFNSAVEKFVENRDLTLVTFC